MLILGVCIFLLGFGLGLASKAIWEEFDDKK